MCDKKVGYILYVIGMLEGGGLLDQNKLDLKFSSSIEMMAVEAGSILSDWDNRIDIQSEEEDGYVMTYAKRVILQRYGKSKSKPTQVKANRKKGKNGFKSTSEHFDLAVDDLLVTDDHGYTKEERLIFDSGLMTIFLDDESEFDKELEGIQEYMKAKGYENMKTLETVNERIAIILK